MSKEQEKFFEEVIGSQVIEVRCNGCGSEQIMNSAYAKYVTNGLLKCSKCRSDK